jgi:hypothetical protein
MPPLACQSDLRWNASGFLPQLGLVCSGVLRPFPRKTVARSSNFKVASPHLDFREPALDIVEMLEDAVAELEGLETG